MRIQNYRLLVNVGVLLVAFLASACTTLPLVQGEMQMDTPMDTPMVKGEHGGAHEAAVTGEDEPFDAMFIDAMIVHHEGAIEMADEVLQKSERPELLALADEVIAAQGAEIEQMRDWRQTWFSELPLTAGMMMEMGDMSIGTDESMPFDQRFLEAMISHHEGALHMAEMALTMSERDEIRTLAENIIAAQTTEIVQMQLWLTEWYGVTP